jgi:small subunit ribosomal protein S5
MAELNTTQKNTNTKEIRQFSKKVGSGEQKQFAERPRPEFDQKILEIRRVTRVVSGGRRMSFAVSMIIGDKNGMVGVGTGKANDTALAIQKAVKDAQKNAISIKRTDTLSLPYDVKAKYCSSEVMIFPNKGKGLVSGAAAREILALAGVRDVTSKVISGSKNKLNTARAVIKALAPFSSAYTPKSKRQIVEEAVVVPTEL